MRGSEISGLGEVDDAPRRGASPPPRISCSAREVLSLELAAASERAADAFADERRCLLTRVVTGARRLPPDWCEEMTW